MQQVSLSDTIAERFWAYVNKNGPIVRPELTPCWVWTGSKNEHGYGKLFIGTTERGTNLTRKAHRIVMYLRTGVWPTDNLLHTCDNAACVNPDHLYPGDQKQNAADRCSRGRSNTVNGERNGKTKIDADTVRAIRLAKRNGCTGKYIGEQFGLALGTVLHIASGKRWVHLDA